MAHSRQPGVTKYPIKEGYILKLINREERFNEKLGDTCPHTVFIWIMKIYQKKVQPKFRKVRIYRFYVPFIEGQRQNGFWLAMDCKVQVNYLTRVLRDGYAVVSPKCQYDHKLESVGRFYRLIGQF